MAGPGDIVDNPTVVSSFEEFKKSLRVGQQTKAVAAQHVINSRSAVGNDFTLNSGAQLTEAATFRFNAATLYDVHTPIYSLNAMNVTTQAKDQTAQAFHYRLTSVNTHMFAQNLFVQQGGNFYVMATKEHFYAAPELLAQGGNNYNYGDYIKIQSGQTTGVKVSDVNPGEKYGCIEMGAIGHFVAKTQNKGIFLDSGRDISAIASGAVRVKADETMSLTSEQGAIFKAEGEMTVSSSGQLYLSAQNMISINCSAIVNIDGEKVYVGMAGNFKAPIDLEAVALGSDLAQQVFSGDFTTALQLPDNISEYSASFLEGLPEQLELEGLVSATSSTLLGSLTPGRIQEFIAAYTGEALAGNVFSGLLQSQLPDFGSYVGGILPRVFTLSNIVSNFTEATFRFDLYPSIKQRDLPGHASGPLLPDMPLTDVSGNVYGQFDSIWRSTPPDLPPLPPDIA